MPKVIKAGGGLVLNPRNEILMIFRRGFWDLPKGKLDDGETIMECAIREVMEETGLPVLIADDPLTCVARGSGMALEKMDTLGSIFTNT